jgi:hypothetical protein
VASPPPAVGATAPISEPAAAAMRAPTIAPTIAPTSATLPAPPVSGRAAPSTGILAPVAPTKMPPAVLNATVAKDLPAPAPAAQFVPPAQKARQLEQPQPLQPAQPAQPAPTTRPAPAAVTVCRRELVVLGLCGKVP